MRGFLLTTDVISIHAPSRERRSSCGGRSYFVKFQSTLPRGSDMTCESGRWNPKHFNPRSLAGATFDDMGGGEAAGAISIHAPSRERPLGVNNLPAHGHISIHAPSRERHKASRDRVASKAFQSTLPRGSDGAS